MIFLFFIFISLSFEVQAACSCSQCYSTLQIAFTMTSVIEPYKTTEEIIIIFFIENVKKLQTLVLQLSLFQTHRYNKHYWKILVFFPLWFWKTQTLAEWYPLRASCTFATVPVSSIQAKKTQELPAPQLATIYKKTLPKKNTSSLLYKGHKRRKLAKHISRRN